MPPNLPILGQFTYVVVIVVVVDREVEEHIALLPHAVLDPCRKLD